MNAQISISQSEGSIYWCCSFFFIFCEVQVHTSVTRYRTVKEISQDRPSSQDYPHVSDQSLFRMSNVDLACVDQMSHFSSGFTVHVLSGGNAFAETDATHELGVDSDIFHMSQWWFVILTPEQTHAVAAKAHFNHWLSSCHVFVCIGKMLKYRKNNSQSVCCPDFSWTFTCPHILDFLWFCWYD